MLQGTAEWSGVPEVVRSSFYVLHKTLRSYDKRLDRCEKAIVDCHARFGLNKHQATVKSAQTPLDMDELLLPVQEALKSKLDHAEINSLVQVIVHDLEATQLTLINEKLQQQAAHFESALLNTRSTLSRKLKDDHDSLKLQLERTNVDLFDQGAMIQMLESQVGEARNANESQLQSMQNAMESRLADIETSIRALYGAMGVSSLDLSVKDLTAHFEPGHLVSESLKLLREEVEPTNNKVAALESAVMSIHDTLRQLTTSLEYHQETKLSTTASRAIEDTMPTKREKPVGVLATSLHSKPTAEQERKVNAVVALVDDFDFPQQDDRHIPTALTRKDELRSKREISKARFEAVALRQRERLRQYSKE
ncbi:hypothetical protein AC1031_015707 [Aphanomyces cochlioides]|nr:hypothetical protein AC1031_015707 [Aphanomyces cochlioides]